MKSIILNSLLIVIILMGITLIFKGQIESYVISKNSDELTEISNDEIQKNIKKYNDMEVEKNERDSEENKNSKVVDTSSSNFKNESKKDESLDEEGELKNNLKKEENGNIVDIKETNKEQPDVTFDFDQVENLSVSDIIQANKDKKNMLIIGTISIPSVNMKLPIMRGVGKSVLASGAGTMKKNQKMGKGNYALASHHIEGRDVLFGALFGIKVKDPIYISDGKYVYVYETKKIKTIEVYDVDIIEDVKGSKLLTLITCADNGTRRLSVQANFIERLEI